MMCEHRSPVRLVWLLTELCSTLNPPGDQGKLDPYLPGAGQDIVGGKGKCGV